MTAIHTQYGGEVTRVYGVDLDEGTAEVEVTWPGDPDGPQRFRLLPLNRLKADGGLKAICEAAERVLDSTGHDSKG